MRDVTLTKPLFAGAVSLESVDGGWLPFRLRTADRDLLHPDLTMRAEMASGVRLELHTDATQLELDIDWSGEVGENEHFFTDLTLDGELIDTQGARPGRSTVTFADLPTGDKRLQIWLPQFGKTIVHGLHVNDGATVEPWANDNRKRWITYGSSITHCRTAHSPARTWPATAARAHDVNLTSIGVGGQCKFDQLVARTIRDQPADFISMKLGINTHGAPSYEQRTWGQAVIGLILTIRDGHPNTPLLIVSPIYGFGRETEAPPAGQTLARMRETLADIVQRFRARGDANIHYLDGLQLLGQADQNLMPDQLHPDGDGYELMGKRFAEHAFAPGGPFAG